jgi:hypothetical protein
MAPDVAIGRRVDAHVTEPVSERLDQLAYDLKHAAGLRRFGVIVDEDAIHAEQRALAGHALTEKISRPYDTTRLDQIKRRQDYVLSELTRMGTVIETCPTSNLRIGGVPTPADHPVHRFLASDVNLIIAADDPGIFDVTLADEVNWVASHGKLSEQALVNRLGDPMRFALRPLE